MSDEAKEVFPCASEQLAGIRDLLAKEQVYDRYHQSADMVVSLLSRVLDHKRGMVASTIQAARTFQEDVLTFLRSFSLMLETVAGAATHGEKAARLRGLIELVETAAGRVRQRQFREADSWSYGMVEDVFRCDYPVKHWISKTREAEARALAAEEEARKVREMWAPRPSVGEPAEPPLTDEDRKNIPF